MKYVPSLAFFAGAVLVGSAIAVLAALWLTDYTPVAKTQPAKVFASQMERATGPEQMKQACLSIARVYDAQTQLIELQNGEIERLFKLLVGLVAAAGFVLGPLLLWIYAATRRLDAPGT
jgi:hypothetical protein